MECLSPRVECVLATTSHEGADYEHRNRAWKAIVIKAAGTRSLDAVRLSLAARDSSADINHVIGTNALVFSPFCRLLGGRGRIIRQVFTSYDRNDRIVRPVRWFANSLFIEAYAFTSPWIGRAGDLSTNTRRFLLRPPVDCDLYRPLRGPKSRVVPESRARYTILYMGPLWPSRFPSLNVLGGLKMLLRMGLDARLVVLTSASRTSPKQCEDVLALSRSQGVENSIVLRRVDLSEAERVQAYNEADVVVYPYVGPEPEKLADPPFGVLESMACARTVLATGVLSVPEVVNDGKTGFLMAEPTAEEIRNGVYRALVSSESDQIGKSAREKIVEEFSYPKICQNALRMYESIL